MHHLIVGFAFLICLGQFGQKVRISSSSNSAPETNDAVLDLPGVHLSLIFGQSLPILHFTLITLIRSFVLYCVLHELQVPMMSMLRGPVSAMQTISFHYVVHKSTAQPHAKFQGPCRVPSWQALIAAGCGKRVKGRGRVLRRP